MTPRIVILGKSGQMAQALAERAKAKSIDCLFLGRDDLDLAQMPLPQTLEDVPADLKQAITSFAPTHILNSAAYTAVDKAEEERDAAFALNEDGARLAARLARLFDVGFIHISTDYVFDGTKEGAYGEDDLTAPQSVYGLSKLAGEKAVCAEHSGAVIIRTSWIISAYGNNFLKSMVRLGQEREALSIVADQTGCPTPALDLADALLAIVQQVPATAAAHERAGIYHA
ncbi:MAG: NAD(P)-dependent oxidoreductase, partial [Cohaesibacter sp.]|nr:NAD(P)-dependent oxidoreductase [Cohaesibacter sp.]